MTEITLSGVSGNLLSLVPDEYMSGNVPKDRRYIFNANCGLCLIVYTPLTVLFLGDFVAGYSEHTAHPPSAVVLVS